MRPEITIYDCITEETIVRVMTDEEFANYEAVIADTVVLPDPR
jgi:hypothetical protein